MIRKTFAVASLAALSLSGCADIENQTVPLITSLTVPTDQGFQATIPNGTMDQCTEDDGEGAPCVYVADVQDNGKGSSFVMLEEYGGPVALVTHEQARALLK